MTRLAAILLTLLAMAALPAGASATTCTAGSEADQIERAEVIFEGVAEPGPATDEGHLISPAVFTVRRYLKGSGGETARTTTGADGRGGGQIAGAILPRAGEPFTILGDRRPDGVIDGAVCTGSRPGIAPPPRSGPAGLEPARGMARIALRARAFDVLRLRGPASAYRESSLRSGWRQHVHRRGALRVDFDSSGRVWSVSTTSRVYRTEESIGVGSSDNRLVRRLEGARCRGDACVLDPGRRGGRFTLFKLRDGLVTRVTVSAGTPS